MTAQAISMKVHLAAQPFTSAYTHLSQEERNLPVYVQRRLLHEAAINLDYPGYQDPLSNDLVPTGSFLAGGGSLMCDHRQMHCPHFIQKGDQMQNQQQHPPATTNTGTTTASRASASGGSRLSHSMHENYGDSLGSSEHHHRRLQEQPHHGDAASDYRRMLQHRGSDVNHNSNNNTRNNNVSKQHGLLSSHRRSSLASPLDSHSEDDEDSTHSTSSNNSGNSDDDDVFLTRHRFNNNNNNNIAGGGREHHHHHHAYAMGSELYGKCIRTTTPTRPQAPSSGSLSTPKSIDAADHRSGSTRSRQGYESMKNLERIPAYMREHGPPLTMDMIKDVEDIDLLAMPRYAQFGLMHRACCEMKRDCYIDPLTGELIFAKTFLEQFPCCGNRCRHCPYAGGGGGGKQEAGGGPYTPSGPRWSPKPRQPSGTAIETEDMMPSQEPLLPPASSVPTGRAQVLFYSEERTRGSIGHTRRQIPTQQQGAAFNNPEGVDDEKKGKLLHDDNEIERLRSNRVVVMQAQSPQTRGGKGGRGGGRRRVAAASAPPEGSLDDIPAVNSGNSINKKSKKEEERNGGRKARRSSLGSPTMDRHSKNEARFLSLSESSASEGLDSSFVSSNSSTDSTSTSMSDEAQGSAAENPDDDVVAGGSDGGIATVGLRSGGRGKVKVGDDEVDVLNDPAAESSTEGVQSGNEESWHDALKT